MDRVCVLDGYDARRWARVEAELERCGARVVEQARLELCIHPRSRDEPRAIRGSARDQPVDHLTHVAAAQNTLLDEELLECSRPLGRGRLVTALDRLMRM